MRHLLLAAVLLVAPVGLAACSEEASSCGSPTATTTVDMQGTAFSPPCVEAGAGATLSLVNHDDMPHTFTVKDTEIDVTIDGGQTATASLAGLAPGTYAVVCTYHPSMTAAVQVT